MPEIIFIVHDMKEPWNFYVFCLVVKILTIYSDGILKILEDKLGMKNIVFMMVLTGYDFMTSLMNNIDKSVREKKVCRPYEWALWVGNFPQLSCSIPARISFYAFLTWENLNFTIL